MRAVALVGDGPSVHLNFKVVIHFPMGATEDTTVHFNYSYGQFALL